jgi:hypothetical protein
MSLPPEVAARAPAAPRPIPAAPPASAPPPAVTLPKLETDWSDLNDDEAVVAAPPPAAKPAPVEVPSLASLAAPPEPLESARVASLDELDFGAPSVFASPPGGGVEAPVGEPADLDAAELPLIEAEEEVDLEPIDDPMMEFAPELGYSLGQDRFSPPPSGDSLPELSLPPLGPPLTALQDLTPPAIPDLTPPAMQDFASPGLLKEAEELPASPLAGEEPPRATATAVGEAEEPEVVAARPAVVAASLAADGGEAQLREALSRASREVIERIAWEVVPQLAETIIREQLDRLVKERQS